jgi:hypothetical protein
MYELLVVACLILQPTRCEEFPVPFLDSMGLTACMHAGQLHLAEWVGEHPDWRVRRWTCGLPRA